MFKIFATDEKCVFVMSDNPKIFSSIPARTISIEPEKETQSSRPDHQTYSNGNNLLTSESSSSDSVNSQDGLIQVEIMLHNIFVHIFNF